MHNIFQKQPQLKPAAMRTVADRRFDDARALCATRDNARGNGAAYMAGFVIEILLKARLVEKYPEIARKREHNVPNAERGIWFLIWRSHNLEQMLERLPELLAALKKKSERSGTDYIGYIRGICATWSIQARYSPLTITIDDAEELLDRVQFLKESLK